MRPFGIPDMAVFERHEGLKRFFAEWLQTFPESTVEVEEVVGQGDWTLTVVLQLAIGGASGAPCRSGTPGSGTGGTGGSTSWRTTRIWIAPGRRSSGMRSRTNPFRLASKRPRRRRPVC